MCELTVTGGFTVGPVASSFTLPDLCPIEDVASVTSVHCTALEGGTPGSADVPISNIIQVSTVNSCMCMVVFPLLICCTHWHMQDHTDTRSHSLVQDSLMHTLSNKDIVLLSLLHTDSHPLTQAHMYSTHHHMLLLCHSIVRWLHRSVPLE